MDAEGTVELDSVYASIFVVDNVSGLMTYIPSITGNFTFNAIARTGAGVKASRMIKVDS